MEFDGRGEMRVSVLSDRHSLKENLKWRSNRRAVVCSMLRIRTLISRTHVWGSYGGCKTGLQNLCHFPAGSGWSSMGTVPTSELCLSSRWPWVERRWNLCKVETRRRKRVTWKWALGFLGRLHSLFALCFQSVDKIWCAQPTSCSSYRPFPPCRVSSQDGFYLSETASPKMLLELRFSGVFTAQECNQNSARAGFHPSPASALLNSSSNKRDEVECACLPSKARTWHVTCLWQAACLPWSPVYHTLQEAQMPW